MRRHRFASALLLATAAAALVACSSDSDDKGGDGGAAATSAAPATGYTVLTPQEGKDLLESGTALTLIDVRTPTEFASGHIEGAVNSDLEGGAFSQYIADLDKDATYVVYCHSGRRAALAADAMVAAGFTHVYDLGGIVDWQAAGYPLVQ